jgi:hypothetical protein
MICSKYTFQKLTQFSQGNNVIDIAASNIDGVLRRDTCVSSTQLNSLFGESRAYLHLETPKLQEVFLSKTKFEQGNNVLDAPASDTIFFER